MFFSGLALEAIEKFRKNENYLHKTSITANIEQQQHILIDHRGTSKGLFQFLKIASKYTLHREKQHLSYSWIWIVEK